MTPARDRRCAYLRTGLEPMTGCNAAWDGGVASQTNANPKQPMSNHTAPCEARPATRDPSFPKTRILVVDDDLTVRGLHAAILTLEGYEVAIAGDGADALEQLAGGRFDLVLTDRQMPILDGEQMVLALRSAASRIPVVMSSGSLPQSPLCARVAREVFTALSKPLRAAEIIAAVYAALHPLPLSLVCAA